MQPGQTNTAAAQDLRAALPERLIEVAAECVPALGSAGFIDLFLSLIAETGAAQVTAFAYQPGIATCLLSCNFAPDSGGLTLAADYADGWFKQDPLVARVLSLNEGVCAVERLENFIDEFSAEYRAKFFGKPGFRTKVAVLVAQNALKMVLSFYCEGGPDYTPIRSFNVIEASVFRLIGRLLATHFQKLEVTGTPPPLVILSERERQVCLGMLAGLKTEAIAAEVGVKPSTIVTYRRRAYEKLGISSRGQLFSICRAASMTP